MIAFGGKKIMAKHIYIYAHLDDYRGRCLYYYFYMNWKSSKDAHDLKPKCQVSQEQI